MTTSPTNGDRNGRPPMLKDFASHLFAPIRLPADVLREVLVPFWHPLHIRRHSAAVIISRVQLVAALFAALVPLCSLVDLLVFPWPEWAGMTALRVAAMAVFALLAWPWKAERTRLRADAMLCCLLLVPLVFNHASVFVLRDLPPTDGAALVRSLYALMPQVVLAGLAVFPLTALEAAAFAVPAFEAAAFAVPAFAFAVLGAAASGASGASLSVAGHVPMLWLMVLLLGASMFSGMSQLHYMTGLVNRAMVDPLTGAYTRRSGAEALDLFFRLSTQQDRPLSVAFFDIDHFKAVNDLHGHEEGDRVLRAFHESLRKGLRASDIVVRWGGEEFVAVLVNTDGDGARTMLERLMAEGFGARPDGTPLTASIGVAERRADGARDWPDLVEKADGRMYAAKRGGPARAVLPDGAVVASAASPVPAAEAVG